MNLAQAKAKTKARVKARAKARAKAEANKHYFVLLYYSSRKKS
jgi:hypothetical protein